MMNIKYEMQHIETEKVVSSLINKIIIIVYFSHYEHFLTNSVLQINLYKILNYIFAASICCCFCDCFIYLVLVRIIIWQKDQF